MDFKQMNAADFRYNIYLMDDGLTFVHFSMYKNETVQKEVLNVRTLCEKPTRAGNETYHLWSVIINIFILLNTFPCFKTNKNECK
jgi:hypothetical protein